MSKCIVCGKDASPEFDCIKSGMRISLCEDHADYCIGCEIRSCEFRASSDRNITN